MQCNCKALTCLDLPTVLPCADWADWADWAVEGSVCRDDETVVGENPVLSVL